jgi:hypothetical protein
MPRSSLTIALTVTAAVFIAGGALWGMNGGAGRPVPAASPVAAPAQPIDPVALDKEIERLIEMRDHILPPAPVAPQYGENASDAFRAGAPAPITQPPAPQSAPGNISYRYTYPTPSAAPTGTSYTYSAYSLPPQAPPANYSYSYTYGSSGGTTLPQNPTSTPPQPPPAPIFTAAPGTRTYTVTTSGRFCEYKQNLSTVLLSGYPFPHDLEVFRQDIVSWSMTAVTFRLPNSFPTGIYGVIVRGYQKYGYCNDVRPGFIKVE